MSELCSRVLALVQTTIVERLRALPRGGAAKPVLLDIGCWDGASTARYGEALGGARLLGVEVFEAPAREAEARGVEVARLDLESAPLPWPDASVDVLVCNQVLEHLKNVWRPMSEFFRVLRPGGHAALSVPNLASLHNRVLLALGRQPTSIRVFGPHVRGYAFGEFRDFVARDGAFTIVRATGVGFHPLPASWTAPLAAVWPSAAHTTLIVARKTGNRAPWAAYVDGEVEGGMQTYYEG